MNSLSFVQRLSIRNKTIVIVLSVSLTVIIVGFGFIATWDMNRLEADIQSSLILDAQLIGDYCVVPLTFDDRERAHEALSRFKFVESVEGAWLFDAHGALFAAYDGGEVETPATAPVTSPAAEFRGGRFSIAEPVRYQGRPLGIILIRANADLLDARMKQLAMTIGGLLLALIVVAYLLALRMQRIISLPIVRLKDQFNAIAATRDYSIRVRKQYDDETGDLYQAFNGLLELIDTQNREKGRLVLELTENRAKLNTVLDTIPQAIFWKDSNGVYQGCNKAFADAAGVGSPEMIAGKTDSDLPWKEEAHHYRADDREVIASGKPRYRYTEPLIRADGRAILVETSKIPLMRDGAGAHSILGVLEDVTERVQAEEALRQSEQRYKQLLESITDYTYSVEIRDCRPWKTVHGTGCEKVTGYAPADYAATPDLWLKMVHPRDRERVEHYADPLCEGTEIPPLEHRIVHKDGATIWVRNTYVLKRDASGRVIGYDGLISNITERRLAEEEIRRLNADLEDRVARRTAQLEAANKELEAFSYSVSHDLRAPLRHASGYVDLLLRRFASDLPEKGRHYLRSIADSVHQMGTLIDDLLQFSRTGRAEMRLSRVDMNPMVGEVVASLRAESSARSVEWNIAQLPPVFCDPAMLRLVWMNLLSNAVKFTRKAGTASIAIGVQSGDAEHVFSVRDNGVGFDMKYAQKLFGVFQRLHPVDEFEGTGIGLANVRRIITRHGGRTWAEAEPDKGATFYFTLPIHHEKPL